MIIGINRFVELLSVIDKYIVINSAIIGFAFCCIVTLLILNIVHKKYIQKITSKHNKTKLLLERQLNRLSCLVKIYSF
jgi:hypothetical protein